MEAVKPKPKLKKKPTGKGKGKTKAKTDKTVAGQQSKPPGGATVEVLNQTPSLEEPSDVKSDSHSTRDDAGVSEVAERTDEVVKSKPLSLKDENKQSEAASTERGVAEESDEIVKSKPLSLKEGDSQDRQPDSVAAAGQIPKEMVQNSGTTLTGDNAMPTLKQEAECADTKPASTTLIIGGVSTTVNNEPKIISQDLDNHASDPTELAGSTTNDSHSHIAPSPATGAVEREEVVSGTALKIQDGGSSQMIESGLEGEGERNIVTLSQVEKIEATVHVQAAAAMVLPSAPALIDFSDESQWLTEQVADVQPVTTTATTTTSAVAVDVSAEGTEDASRILYPRLDSIMQESEYLEEMQPFTEEDLSILYPNPQLDTQTVLEDTFIRMSNQEHHELYELLMSYLKSMQALSNSQKHVEALRGKYHTHQVLLWHAEPKEITCTGRCGDGNKVTHSHNYKYATFNSESAAQVISALKETRELLQEELCMHAYSSQLARIHVEHYLFQLMQSYPELNGMTEDAPPTNWVPNCPPGGLDSHNTHLRDSISVLFMFIRKPVVDVKFSEDCRHWLDILLSALLRVATLTDHQFIFHHLLRSPPGVGKWGAPYLHLLSPLQTKQLLTAQYQNRAPPRDLSTVTADMGYSQDWGVGLGLHSDWGGPVLDHFMTMLATLLLPIKERDLFLPEIGLQQQQQDRVESGADYSRSVSQPWVFVEDIEEDEIDCEGNANLLKESDFIAFFDQFPFTDLYQYILMVPMEGEFNVQSTTSYQMLRLLAFCTCLIRLLGAAFSTLKLARYKEFIKRVGRTIRLTVQYVADHWVTYKAHRLSCGETMASLPPDTGHGDPRYSLNRLQLEFDQFVLRATKWILTAHKLGAWQFLADMPYGSISLKTAWMIFWNIYCKDQGSGTITTVPGAAATATEEGGGGGEVGGQRARARTMSPSTTEEIQGAIRGGDFKDQFVDRLMKTYTSEAVFLLTTLVNMARARPADSEDERHFINTIVLEIFECTHVVEYARDTYSRTGSTLLDSIAIVHPFTVSNLLNRATTPTGSIRENFILLFKELPLHLWLPESHDLHVIRNMLTEHPLSSFENLLARVILSGLNWGTKSEDGSSELVLPWSMHCSVALMLVEAHSKLFPTQPGGRDYVPMTSSLRNYASLHRFTMSSEQQEFVTWAWEVGLMLKLHPNQLLSRSMQTLSPTTEQHSQQTAPSRLSEPSWVQVNEGRNEVILPDLTSTGARELADLRDAVKYEGLLAYYVTMCITSIGTDTDHFIGSGLSMLNRLIEQGYYLPALRILANSTPPLFKHSKILVEDSNFPQIVMAIANADIANATLKERWTFATPTPLVARKMAALLQTQLQSACRPGGVGGETVLRFWLDILLSWPTWVREKSVLLLLDTLCMAAFKEPTWQKIIMDKMMENYRIMDPTQPKRSLLSSVYSSVASIVGQDGGPPSIFNAVPRGECPWLAYTTLCAEQGYEEEEGIWKALLQQLRQDPKATVDTALKRAFSDLKTLGGFTANHLCIYRWAEFCTELETAHPLFPVVWQQFFMLYLQRPKLDDSSMPERESFGIRFFASNRAISIRRKMKNTLSTTRKQLQSTIAELEGGEGGGGERSDQLRTFLPQLLKLCQTFRLWLEDPRLHTASLYLPGLPREHDSDRLVTVFQADKSQLWYEFVPAWTIRGEQNRLVEEWMEVAAYQKPLRSKAYPPESSPDTAISRIQKRLNRKVTPSAPPPFHYCSAPFSLLSPDLLVSQNSLLGLVHTDIDYLRQQAKSFCTKVDALSTLDSVYESAIPQLYTNEVRQFHVRVPCRPGRFSKNHQCGEPAVIVFRFDEMTVNPRWDQQIQVNRVEYDSMMQALCKPISKDLCPIILRLEHTVTELSKLSDQNQGAQINVPLQCGIALFYKIVEFISPEIRQFPPTCQILTTCIQLLGQEFIGRDPLQTTNLLDLLLTQNGKSDLIVPLFQPNLCPEQFLHMYGSAAEICVKDGASIAFSVLTKFNVVEWLESYDPSMGERTQLLEFINQGLTLYGKHATMESEMLVEVYRQHFIQLVEHKFPDLYSGALQMLINGTDNANVILTSWSDLCQIVCSSSSPESCKLGLQQATESLQLLSSHYLELRCASEQTLYSLLSKEYVPLIGKFIEMLCIAVVTKWKKAIAEDTAKPTAAITSCWQSILDVFTPWVVTLPSSGGGTGGPLPPCLDSEINLLKTMMTLFVNCVSKAHSQLQDPLQSVSVMGLLWTYYCSSLSQPSTPRHVLSTYHSTLEELPWSLFFPDLAAMDAMMKLRLMDNIASFVFLGKVFPLLDWKTIAAAYSDASRQSDSSLPVQFHIMFLQVVLMLAAEKQIMDREGTGVPEVIAEAHCFHWEFIDAKTYQDILNWQKSHCEPSTILQPGSCLSLALRLLKAVAGFPTSSGPREVPHNDTWEKRLAYLQVTVELIAMSSEKQSTHNQSYAQPVSHLFETAVDIAVQEPSEIGGSNMLSTIQEILNLLNICSPSGGMIQNITTIMFDIMDQMAAINVLSLSIITAGCKALASLHTMVVVVEHTINCFFSNNLAAPQSVTLELPADPANGYGWKYITNSLCLPEDSTDEIYQNCISECAVLIIHAQLMQELPHCTSIAQEFRIAIKVVQWCTQLKPPPTSEAKIFLLWEKALSLLLRQARFVGNHNELVPQFTALATSMIRFGEDKATDGILGVIGLGKKTCYSHRFRLVSRAMAAFLHCQMPVDGRQTTILRVVPNAPGHVKDLPRQQNPSGIGATKQGNHTIGTLESLLTDKHYAALREHATYAVNFVNNPSNCIVNCNYLLVYLSTVLYPECRYLDLLRVLQI